MKRVLGSIRRADERYRMIEDGDRVCIGVSGGKDSLLLMEAMKLYQRFCYTRFDVCAVMLDLGLRQQDTSAIEAYAARIGMDFTVIHTDIGKVVFEYRQERSPCALCAKLRRGALNTAAVERGCNKVALGHNREDVLETLFMSMLYEGRINTFAPVTHLSRRNVTVIRPLIFLPENMRSPWRGSASCRSCRPTATLQGRPSARRRGSCCSISRRWCPTSSRSCSTR